jgi:hypothetical protein
MKRIFMSAASVLAVAIVTSAAHATVTFSTFVNGSDIAALEGGN